MMLIGIRPMVIGTALVLFSVTMAVGCGGSSGSVSTSGEPTEVEIAMKDNFFEPKQWSVKAKQPVKIETKNEGQAAHNIRFLTKDAEGKDFAGASLVQPGQEDTFQVTFTKPGTYKYQCDYHLPDMSGMITVQ